MPIGKKGDIEDNCPNRQCNAAGRDAVDSGQSAALVSSIGFAVGIAGAGATVALFLLSRSDAPKDADAVPSWRAAQAHRRRIGPRRRRSA